MKNLAIDITPADPKLSNTHKMPCKSWSLEAVSTCPGARGKDGALVPACAGCYASKGTYLWGTVKKPRLHNQEDWQKPDWEDAMISLIQKQRSDQFRWFDSGDCYHVGLAEKIYRVMKACPDTRFWLPTRMYKFAKFKRIFDKMNKLPNVVVRFSADGVNGERLRHKHTSTIIQNDAQAKGAHICPAVGVEKKLANCAKQGCDACWSKDVPVIAYPYHA